MSKSKGAQREQPSLPSRYGRVDVEVNKGEPVEMPIGACHPEPLESIIARMVHQHVSDGSGEEQETFEEADDFEEEDPDTVDLSPYELTDIQTEAINPQEPSPEDVEAALKAELPEEEEEPKPESEPPSEVSEKA